MPTVRYIGWGVGNEVLTTLLSYINGHVIMLLKKLKFHFQTWGAELQTILGLMATLWWRINLHSTWYNIEIFIRLMLHKLRNKGNSVVPRYTWTSMIWKISEQIIWKVFETYPDNSREVLNKFLHFEGKPFMNLKLWGALMADCWKGLWYFTLIEKTNDFTECEG